jgi:hypothetical protein
MYTPLNVDVYLSAQAGAMAGMFVSGKQPTDQASEDYNNSVLLANSYAEEFDTQWGANDANESDIFQIQFYSTATWQNRTPSFNPAAREGTTYATLVGALIALIESVDANNAGNDITPPEWGGAATSSAYVERITPLVLSTAPESLFAAAGLISVGEAQNLCITFSLNPQFTGSPTGVPTITVNLVVDGVTKTTDTWNIVQGPFTRSYRIPEVTAGNHTMQVTLAASSTSGAPQTTGDLLAFTTP